MRRRPVSSKRAGEREFRRRSHTGQRSLINRRSELAIASSGPVAATCECRCGPPTGCRAPVTPPAPLSIARFLAHSAELWRNNDASVVRLHTYDLPPGPFRDAHVPGTRGECDSLLPLARRADSSCVLSVRTPGSLSAGSKVNGRSRHKSLDSGRRTCPSNS